MLNSEGSSNPINIPNAKVYLVGGAVRDEQLVRQVHERDWVVVGSNAKQMLQLGFKQVGADFPVFIHPSSGEEYALARQERKSGQGYIGFETQVDAVSLKEDLARRDLTINAIAQPANDIGSEQPTLIDPYHGLDDLKNKTLRHVSDAFIEDPVRLLRIARFAAQLADYDFTVAEETQTLLTNMVQSGEVNTLTPERIWKETEKALAAPHPWLFFEVLQNCGALKVIFPEIDALFGVPQKPNYHPEIDCGIHTILSLKSACDDTDDSLIRFATLVHDLGKATTPSNILPSHYGHEKRGAVLVDKLCDRLKIPNAYRHLGTTVATWHLHSHMSLRMKPSKVENLLSHLGAWSNNSSVLAFCKCCRADARGRTGLHNRPYPQYDFLQECEKRAKSLPIKEITDLGFTGVQIGKELQKKRIAIIKEIQCDYAHIDELAFAKA